MFGDGNEFAFGLKTLTKAFVKSVKNSLGLFFLNSLCKRLQSSRTIHSWLAKNTIGRVVFNCFVHA